METGILFDIQRNSTVDGPGIRTAVFFKGCNLRCRWCHNPEGIAQQPQMLHYKKKAVLCGREYTVTEVMAEIQKDILFYNASGGGVTFSGGECMLQPDFLARLLQGCREQNIHTAVDTAGCVSWASFERILPYTDLFLYDIKVLDSGIHKEYTGAENTRILENLQKLSQRGKDIIVRVPVIPGVNDREEEIREIARFANNLGIRKIELLPYHGLGTYKYEALGIEPAYYPEPNTKAMERLNTVLGKELL